MTTPITTRSRTATAAHTEPTVMARVPEVCCEALGDTVGLDSAEELGTVELRQANSPESSNSVHAIDWEGAYIQVKCNICVFMDFLYYSEYAVTVDYIH